MARTETRNRGARPLHLPDWPYGAVGRRLVLQALLLGRAPAEGWSKAELEESARTKPGGIDGVLAGAVDWGLLERTAEGRWQRPQQEPPIASPLQTLLALTRRAEDRPIAPLARRPYRRRP